MITEDFIKQVARDISHRLMAGETTGRSQQARTAQTLLLFDDEAGPALRNAARAAYPDAEIVTSIAEGETLAGCGMIVLIAPSLDLASKIALLQTDCPTAKFIIRALLGNKRVIIVTEGMLASRPAVDSPPTGIFRAVEELRAKLSGLGIELIPAANMGRTPETPAARPNTAVRSVQLPVLPISQHPSRQRLQVTDALNEFVDFLQTKQCTMEKNKPCDHCDICNTLGF